MVVPIVADLAASGHAAAEQATTDRALKDELAALLAGGLKTQTMPRAYSQQEVAEVVSRLQALGACDYTDKLVIAGFTLTPYLAPDPDGGEAESQACETCMYYQVHRRFCELPELMLPVEPQWSCRLWRI